MRRGGWGWCYTPLSRRRLCGGGGGWGSPRTARSSSSVGRYDERRLGREGPRVSGPLAVHQLLRDGPGRVLSVAPQAPLRRGPTLPAPGGVHGPLLLLNILDPGLRR